MRKSASKDKVPKSTRSLSNKELVFQSKNSLQVNPSQQNLPNYLIHELENDNYKRKKSDTIQTKAFKT